ncbi:MAG: phosphoribosylaminoimidazolesuccinocarboxamide synthase [Chlamydiales bacterium]|nr:phosphoribosylaminoimidazolesuccinocarboxamide synthase [Chlamydiia bacterium]MCP5508488.1 phosphoribosylaminoimidazolesuccinocarboxamide synthase [Chlamydiales bacterium]
MTQTLRHTFIPELGMPTRGKVRDIYNGDKTLMLIASDRISVFNYLLKETIQDKGRLLTALSLFWFEKTKDIISNHLITQPDPNVLIVKRCKVIPIEMVVRRYMVGSLWRQYAAGARTICGITLPDGLKENDLLPSTIITPTMKSEHDENTSKEELITKGIVTEALWNQMEDTALRLFARGEETVKPRGLILVDTKYEFGLDTDGDLILIDEIHTPDSSRYWFTADAEAKEFKYPDKEFARQYVRDNGFEEGKPLPSLPFSVVQQIYEGYRHVYETITGETWKQEEDPVQERLLNHLKDNNIITGRYVLIICETEKERQRANAISQTLTEAGTPNDIIVTASSNVPLTIYNESLEPMVCISIGNEKYNKKIGDILHWPTLKAADNDKETVMSTLQKLGELESK